MTKPCTPNSLAEAVRTIGKFIGWDKAADAVLLKQRVVRLWGEEDKRKHPSIAQVLALETAYALAGGEGTPIIESMRHQVAARVDRTVACHRALLEDVAHLSQEHGDAVAATLAITPGSPPAQVHRAIAEVKEAGSALKQVARRLASFIPIGAGPDAVKTGGAR